MKSELPPSRSEDGPNSDQAVDRAAAPCAVQVLEYTSVMVVDPLVPSKCNRAVELAPGVTLFDGADAGPVPTAFVAVTVKV